MLSLFIYSSVFVNSSFTFIHHIFPFNFNPPQMSKSKNNPNTNSIPNCFSTIFRRLICSGDLPTYPDHDHNQTNKIDSSSVIINDKKSQFNQVELETVPQMKPGIVARLMGLDSMPDNNTYTPNESLFFKSKSLNSLNFFPDFNSNRASYSALHRRSASFSHLGSSFSFKIDEEVNSSKLHSHENRGGAKQSVKKQGKGEKVVETNLKGNQRGKSRRNQKYEESYTTKTRRSVKNNNVGRGRGGNLIRDQKCALLVKKQGKLRGGRGVNDVGLRVSSKRRVHHDHDKEQDLNNHVADNEVLSDSLSRSPVSVLDHHLLHLELDYSPSKDTERGTTSSTTRKKPTTKTKTKIEGRKSGNNYQKLNKEGDQEPEMAEYFVGLLGQMCRLTEEHVKDPKWVAKSRGFKVQFVEELSLDFGGQILDLLLNELTDELLII